MEVKLGFFSHLLICKFGSLEREMNRSFRAQESSRLLDSAARQRQQLRASMMAEKDEELSLFLEMRRREKEQDSLLLNNNPDEFEYPLGKYYNAF